MLDRTKIHFKKAVKEVAKKSAKPHKETMSLLIDNKVICISLFLGNTTFYSLYIFEHESKTEINEKMDGFRKMYYAWIQVQNKKGGWQ